MSTNPFRRSSLKGFDGSGGGSSSNIATPSSDFPRIDVDATAPLSVNTKVPTSTQKHVNFASPPAIPISPVSYPPSPESTRISPAFQNTRPILPLPTDYSQAIQHDPFRAEARTDEDDGAITQALVNAKVNTTLAAPTLNTFQEYAVRDTLSRFASAPKRQADAAGDTSQPSQASIPQRQTMDVDAFKRLLLTGDTGPVSHKTETPMALSTVTGDSSSGTDTASISQRSMFDPAPAADISSESSDDVSGSHTYAIPQAGVSSEAAETKRKPPPPKPRHGKAINEDSVQERVMATTLPQAMPPHEPTESLFSAGALKVAPTPPLARRSQNSTNARPPSSRNSSSSDVTAPTGTTDNGFKAPPPPRARRPNTGTDRRPSGDLPPTEEEPDYMDSSAPSSRKASESRPPPPPSRNSSKRISTVSTNPPPVPPPRRGRGSSRSSIESQRPSMSHIFNNENLENNTAESARMVTESRKSIPNSTANDILADLAALQREVDEARIKVTK